jgi:hypothetical protein
MRDAGAWLQAVLSQTLDKDERYYHLLLLMRLKRRIAPLVFLAHFPALATVPCESHA